MKSRLAEQFLEVTKMATSEQQQTTDSPTREVAKRVFAAELNQATYTFKTSQEERAPVYAVLPTGERANRVLVAGTVTDIENVGDEEEYLRVRVVDPTGTFFVYAGFYQPEAMQKLKTIQPPEFVILVGKPRTYKTEAGRINVSLVPESVNVIDRATRDRWVFETAAYTFDRLATAKEETPQAAAMAREQYGNDGSIFGDIAAFALQDLVDGRIEMPDEMEETDVDDVDESDVEDVVDSDSDAREGEDEAETEDEEDSDDLDERLKALDNDMAANGDAGQKKSAAELGRSLADPSNESDETDGATDGE